ncbi:hypothetical protein MoryE10_29540 [Methylogaea oryzae]|uniref:TonB C-terminal domain-containing protein n=1 Tax=Methylogaea oryzae TaxID=1295382 RepID=A0A8D4VQS5_9GAMM|nr:hypothetical protein MoryE10_29540 [Methylogaea oryzae]
MAVIVATALHLAAWQAWRNQPAAVPARLERAVEVALVSQPRLVAQPQPEPPKPPPPKPPEKPLPKKPKPLPRPVPLKQAEPAPTPEPVAEAPPPPAAAAPAAPAPAPFQEANYKANYLQNPPPRYPSMARERHWQGEVLVRTRILADGTAGEVRLERSSGHDVLDEAALEAVRQWRFVAAKEGDKAVDSWVIIPIDFKLKN